MDHPGRPHLRPGTLAVPGLTGGVTLCVAMIREMITMPPATPSARRGEYALKLESFISAGQHYRELALRNWR